MFARLFRKDPMKAVAARLYDDAVKAARRPSLYGPAGAPDTVDGRFDMIVLHAVILMRRLRAGGEGGKAAAQAVFDHMFSDMDAALREMGTGDLSVGKKIRAMAEAFYGRAQAYDSALDAGDEAALAEVIQRNMIEGEAVAGPDGERVPDAPADAPGPAARRLALYALKAEATLQESDPEALAEGRTPGWPAAH